MDVTGVSGFSPQAGYYGGLAQEVGARALGNAIEQMDMAGHQLVDALQNADPRALMPDGVGLHIDVWA